MLKIEIKNIIFFFMSLSLIFNMTPFDFGPISGLMHRQLLFFWFIIGLVYTCFIYKNEPCFFRYKKYLRIYLLIFAVCLIVSSFLGFVKFPYYSCVFTGESSYVNKMVSAFSFLGISIDSTDSKVLYMILRQVKIIFSDVLYAFGFSYIIFCWYKDDWYLGYKVFLYGVIASSILVGVYSSVEILFLAGNNDAKNILVNINPYIHTINNVTPVLWFNQLRSVFKEPSNFGNYIAYSLPMLWYLYYKGKNIKLSILTILYITYFTVLVFLTRARTANAIFYFMVILLVFGTLFYFRDLNSFKKVGVVILASLIAFSLAVSFVDEHMSASRFNTLKTQISKTQISNDTNTIESTSVSERYIEDNLLSLTSANKRSNIPRYAYLTSSFQVGLDNFWFGTGRGLQTMYVLDKMTQSERDFHEIKRIENSIKKYGIFAANIDAMNEYVSRFCQTGFIGLIIFLLPFIYVIHQLLKLINIRDEYAYEYSFILLMLLSAMVAGMNGSVFLNYSLWLILGIAYAAIKSV
ncbi:MAG: O-antigen ligase family protein [Phascolarctobacterium sp.]|nr:O-antigen ligase family protein [Phascolarctobacterium sp.]